MPILKILIRETLGAVNRMRTRTVAVQEIAALDHKVANHAVEPATLVALRSTERIFCLARAELAEVLRGAWNDVGEDFHFDPAQGFAAEGDVEEDDGVGLLRDGHGCGEY